MARPQTAVEGQSKAEARFLKGAWLGRNTQNDGHVVVTSSGVIVCRTVRGLTETETSEGELSKLELQWSGVTWVGEGRNPRGVHFAAPSEQAEEALEETPAQDTALTRFWATQGKNVDCYGLRK